MLLIVIIGNSNLVLGIRLRLLAETPWIQSKAKRGLLTMFCTSPDGEIRIPPVFESDEEYWWSYVRRPLFIPYFVVVCSEATSQSSQTFFLETVDQLAQVVGDTTIELKAVQLVSPGHMNGTGIWQIDVLESVFQGLEVNEENCKQYAFVYAVSGGKRYLQSCIANAENDLADLELVLDLSAYQPESPM